LSCAEKLLLVPILAAGTELALWRGVKEVVLIFGAVSLVVSLVMLAILACTALAAKAHKHHYRS
jgi:hypothetical protein